LINLKLKELVKYSSELSKNSNNPKFQKNQKYVFYLKHFNILITMYLLKYVYIYYLYMYSIIINMYKLKNRKLRVIQKNI